MQYKGSEILCEVVWIIFDEVYYMYEKEWCVVLEESIMMVVKPKHNTHSA